MRQEYTKSELKDLVEAGAMVINVETEVIHELWGVALKELPFDRYYIGLCECKRCKAESIQAWPGMDNKFTPLYCENCRKPSLTPVPWIKT